MNVWGAFKENLDTHTYMCDIQATDNEMSRDEPGILPQNSPQVNSPVRVLVRHFSSPVLSRLYQKTKKQPQQRKGARH